jgi:hypothetical protein
MRKKKDLTREIAEELDLMDDMLDALVELLEEKGILTHEEWEDRIKTRIERNKKLTSYRDVQFESERHKNK